MPLRPLCFELAWPQHGFPLPSFLVIICSGGFVCCLFYASQAGSFIFSLFDDYLVPLNLMLIVLFQTATLTCLYGLHR